MDLLIGQRSGGSRESPIGSKIARFGAQGGTKTLRFDGTLGSKIERFGDALDSKTLRFGAAPRCNILRPSTADAELLGP